MTTANELAIQLGISGPALRARLRRRFPDHQPGTPWYFTPEEAAALVAEFTSSQTVPALTVDAPASQTRSRADSDEAYVLDLCDEHLGQTSKRQHTFEWLLGDPNPDGKRRRLPVDAYYPTYGLIVEYRERQHFESTPFFDKPERPTVSGIPRAAQRRRYDQRRETEIPAHGLRLVVISVNDLASTSSGKLRRERASDLRVIAGILSS